MRIYPPEEWKILSHAILNPNMDWNPSILNLNEYKYVKYDECIEEFGCWDNTSEHVVCTSKVLTNDTQDFPFFSNLCYTEETKAPNICLEYLCGDLYPFIKNLPVRYVVCNIINYKPPLFYIKYKDNEIMTQGETSGINGKTNETNKYGYPNSPQMLVLKKYGFIGDELILPPKENDVNMPHDKIPGKNGENSEPNKHGDPNSPNIAVFIEHGIYGHTFLLIPQ